MAVLGEVVKTGLFYLFALAYHVIALLIMIGLFMEIFDDHTNWSTEKGCYKGGNGLYAKGVTKVDGTTSTQWFNYFGSDGTPVNATAPTECNHEATAEIIIALTGVCFVTLDTVATVLVGLVNLWTKPKLFRGGKFFKSWEGMEDNAGGTFLKACRAAGVFGAYLTAFVWACGFTAAFNSRPHVKEDAGGDDINVLFEMSSFLVAFMISILVTILPAQKPENGGYSMLWE